MSKVDAGLNSLVSALLPALPEEEEHLVDQRHDEALRLAKDILDEYVLQKHGSALGLIAH